MDIGTGLGALGLPRLLGRFVRTHFREHIFEILEAHTRTAALLPTHAERVAATCTAVTKRVSTSFHVREGIETAARAIGATGVAGHVIHGLLLGIG